MPDTNYISKVTLPSAGTTGITYYIKDEEARQMISGGISFKIVWTQADYASSTAPSAAKLATIPAGVVIGYNNGASTATGTLAAAENTVAIFYLVYSKTQAGNIDTFDEFVTITNSDTTPVSYFWEKIGDTQVDLSNVVTNVTLNPSTETIHNPGTPTTKNAIGANSTFTITQPTIALATDTTSGTGKVQVVTGISSASASGDSVTALTGLGTPSTDTVLKGAKPKENSSSVTGAVQYVKSQGTATTTKLSATASGAAVSASGDNVTVVTGYTPSTGSAASSVTPTTKKLATSSVTGVQASTTTASKATVGTATSQTTATGGTSASTNNSDILKGISVSNETLIFGACTLGTQTTSIPNISFSDVTVPIKAASATTVATGAVTTTGSGADIVTDVAVGDTVTVVTGLGTPATDTVIGTGSTFTVTNPSVTIASGSTGDVTVATGIGSATTRYLTIDADGTATAVTGYASPTTDTVIGTASTITVTPETTYIKGSASGANTAWNNKDTVAAITGLNTSDVTVLGNATSIDVTKGGTAQP